MTKEITDKEIENLLNNIVCLRRRHRLSKRAMAKILGIGVGTLNKMERLQLPPRLGVEIFFRIHAHFGIRPKDLLLGQIDEL